MLIEGYVHKLLEIQVYCELQLIFSISLSLSLFTQTHYPAIKGKVMRRQPWRDMNLYTVWVESVYKVRSSINNIHASTFFCIGKIIRHF